MTDTSGREKVLEEAWDEYANEVSWPDAPTWQLSTKAISAKRTFEAGYDAALASLSTQEPALRGGKVEELARETAHEIFTEQTMKHGTPLLASRFLGAAAKIIATALRIYAGETAAQSERAGLERAAISKAEVEAAAQALYECESKRGEQGNATLSKATGKSIKGLSVEPWEECAETFRADARQALSAARKAGGE